MYVDAASVAVGLMDKHIFDPIHGHMQIESSTLRLVDTPHFQRLRDLKQLGAVSYVFPGAVHTRFDHSIGVAHLAESFMLRLQGSQPELGITARDVFYVKAAGLCHDLGHGPFSHAFENQFLARVAPDLGWKHEDASVMMLRHMAQHCDTGLDKRDVDIIADLFRPTRGARLLSPDKHFMYDIVANGRNSVDVDKFDYLQRDCHFLGLKYSYDCDRLMKMSRVINNQICYHRKEAFNVVGLFQFARVFWCVCLCVLKSDCGLSHQIYELFHARYNLHRQVYTHRAGKAIEYMIADALTHADSVMGISKCIHDPEQYVYMTDSILNQIERSKDESLRKSREIISRIRQRKLYKMAHDIVLTWKDSTHFHQVKEEDIASHHPHLEADDIVLDKFSLNYSMRDQNPVTKVKFFESENPDRCFSVPRRDVSLLIPEEFSEVKVRVFVRHPTSEKVDAACLALKSYARQHSHTSAARQ